MNTLAFYQRPLRTAIALASLSLAWVAAPHLFAGEAPIESAVKICLHAEGSKGSPLVSLKKEDIRVSVDKKPVEPSSIQGTGAPTLIVLVFDTTGDPTYIDVLRKELLGFIDVLPPGVQLMVMTANDGIKVVQNNTADKKLLREAVLNYGISGRPGFMENVTSVAELTTKLFLKNAIRVAVVFFTDSEIYKYRKRYTSGDLSTEADRIKDRLKEAYAPVYALRLPIANNDSFNRNYEGAIRDIVRVTGGDAEFPLMVAGVSQAVRNILLKISGTYVLDLPAGEFKAGKEYRVGVEIGSGAASKLEYKKSFRIPK